MNRTLALLIACLALAGCRIGDPSLPGAFTYGTGVFAETTVAQQVALNDGGQGWTIRCGITLDACRQRASDLCPRGYSRITPDVDDPGPSLADPVRTTTLQQANFMIRCAGA